MAIETQVDHSVPTLEEINARYKYALDFIGENGVGICHYRPTIFFPEGHAVSPVGGMTAAFRKQGSFMQVATAICSPDDRYNGKLGTALATERLANNQAILVPLHGFSPRDAVDDLFKHLYQDHSLLEGGAYDEPGFNGQESDDEPGDLKSAESREWHQPATTLVNSLLTKLGGEPADVLQALKYLLEEADDRELAAILAGTPAEQFAGSSAVLDIVRSTAVSLLTSKKPGDPRLVVAIEKRPVLPDESPFEALSKGLSEMVKNAQAQIKASAHNDKLSGIKEAFGMVPAADLLAALRNSPHAAAAAQFLTNLQAPRKHSGEEDHG